MPHRTSAVVLIVAALWLAGCSADQQMIRSTETMPMSATIVDATTQEALWSMDVPPGHTLLLDAAHRQDAAFVRVGDAPATSMAWKLYASQDSRNYTFCRPVEAGSVDLPGHTVRIDVDRSTPQPTTTLPPRPAPSTIAPAPSEVEQQMDQAADAAEPLPTDAPKPPELAEPAEPAEDAQAPEMDEGK